MQQLTSHLAVMSRGAIVLLLAFMYTFALQAQQEDCPAWPRQLDQAFFCYHPDDRTVVLRHEGSLHNPVRFTFPTLPSDITVTFDAGDGVGIRTVSSGQIITVTYPNPGQYNLTTLVRWDNGGADSGNQNFRFQSNFNNVDANYADFLPHETWANISGNTYTPPSNGAYPPGSSWNDPVTAGGIVSILYANPDHRFRKPFILVDGFDPVLEGMDHFVVQNLDGTTLGFGSVRWDVLMTGRDETLDVDPNESGVPHDPRFRNFPSLVQGLRNQGYDIVLVDLADGGTYIQANAEFLIKVIEQINNHKVGTFPNALFGASMGGFIGRYALAKMEKDGKKHCTGLFGTLDTPNNGANIPLSLQAFTFFSHLTGPADNRQAQAGWKAAETPAARQMLIQHFGDEVQSGRISLENIPMNIIVGTNIINFNTPLNFDELNSSDYSALRKQFKTDLTGLGWPKEPRKVAILDGMKNGTLAGPHGFGAGGKIYDVSGYAHNQDFGTVYKMAMYASNGGGPEDFTVHGIPNSCTGKWNFHDVESGNILFKAAQPSDLNNCFGSDIPYKYYNVTAKSQTELLHLDNAPGGYRLDLRTLNDGIKTTLEDKGLEFINPVKFPIATFTPTWSSLAMATPLNNANLFVDLTTSEFAEENLPNSKVPNYDNFYAPAASLRHVEVDGGMVAFILAELARLNAAPQEGVLTETYNYGKRYKEIPTTIVASTGRLNINNTGATGFVNSNPSDPAVKPTFTTYLRDCGERIDVEAGGQYNIGALDKSQHGITEVWDQGVVHIHSGGTLHITSNGSKLYIKHGATLIIDPGAIIQLESQGSTILIEGDLIVNGDFKFSGLGYFEFSTGNKLIYGDGYNIFNLQGAGKDKRFVRLSAPLVIDNAHRLNWSNGLVEVGNEIYLTAGAGLNFTSMTLQGIGGATVINALNSGAITLESCDVKSLDLAINGENGEGCIISACTFSNYLDRQVTWINTGSVQVLHSTFDGNSAINALWFENIFATIIKGSVFQGHGDPLTGTIDDNDLMGAGAAIELYDVTACMVIGSHFSNNGVGIKSRDNEHPSNIYIYRGSSFTNNEAGVFVNGDQTRGTVLSDCSLYENNGTAIRGRDITLMIDCWNSAAWSFDTDSPNRFIRNGWGAGLDKYIRICYDLKAVGGSTQMRNNFWGAIGSPDQNPQDHIQLLDKCAVIKAPGLMPFAQRIPDCGPYERPASFAAVKPGTDCTLNTVNIPGRPVYVDEQFQLGTYLLREEQFEEAIVALRPVAALWQPNMTTFTDNCQQYIKVAKAFVDGNDASGLPRPSVDRDQPKTPGNLTIAPNPTMGTAILYLPEAEYRIRVMDLQGKTMFQTTATGNYRIETAGWASGIYMVEAYTSTGVRKSGKLIVQQ